MLLTDKFVAALDPSERGQRIVRDGDLKGFFVLVGTRTKSFMVQADLRSNGTRRSLRVKIGDFDTLSVREARAKAKTILGSIAQGIDPRAKSPRPAQTDDLATLSAAWESYRASHLARKGRAEKTIKIYRDHVDRLFADWLEKPLIELARSPALVRAKHNELTAANGGYMANSAMRTFRAIYNHAKKADLELPAFNPVAEVDWNREKRRDTGLGLAELKVWFEQLAVLENPVRREFQLCCLLTGSRPEALKSVRLSDVDLRFRILHIPRPKGGEERAFDIPLSRELVRSIVRTLRLGQKMYPEQSQTWLFPADSSSGHLSEHKEDRAVLSKWGIELRQTYRTVGQAAGVGDLDMHLLMNHSIPGVNAGYITRGQLLGDHLRSQQQKVSSLILQSSQRKKSSWPYFPSRVALVTATGRTYGID